MPRNFKLCVLLLVSALILMGFGFVMRLLPIRQPVGFSVQSYSNDCVVVVFTNLTRTRLAYQVTVERKGAEGWPIYRGEIPVKTDNGQMGALGGGQTTNLELRVMAHAPLSLWRVSLFCWNAPKLNGVRFKAVPYLLRLHMPTVAQWVIGRTRTVQVSGPQMEQL
jgi:hypothetical protein